MNKLTILVEPEVYRGLYAKVGRGKISKFINDSVKPLLSNQEDLKKQYQELALESNTSEAGAWQKVISSITSENSW
jgi:hypothetical protein